MFASMDSTIILSALQGHMGRVWVDDLENPTAAQVTVGIFVFMQEILLQREQKNFYTTCLILHLLL